MINDHRRVALDGVKVFFLEGVAGLRRHKHFPGEGDGAAGVFLGDWLLGGQRFVYAHDEFRNVMQPGELRVVDHQLEELAGVDVAMLAFVFAALHVEKSFMQAEKREAKGEKLLAGRGIAVRRE